MLFSIPFTAMFSNSCVRILRDLKAKRAGVGAREDQSTQQWRFVRMVGYLPFQKRKEVSEISRNEATFFLHKDTERADAADKGRAAPDQYCFAVIVLLPERQKANFDQWQTAKVFTADVMKVKRVALIGSITTFKQRWNIQSHSLRSLQES